MSLVRSYQPRGGQFHRHGRPFYGRNKNTSTRANAADYNCNYDNYAHNTKLDKVNHDSYNDFSQNCRLDGPNYDPLPDIVPSSKRRKISALSFEGNERPYQHQNTYQNDVVNHADQSKPSNCYNAYSNAYLVSNSSTVVRCEDVSAYDLTNSKRDRSTFEDDEVVLMSRDEIERCSPSRKDGIDPLQEAHLRYSYCVFLQNLGIRLNLPQTTIGTAMVLCHRFFVRRSHASHDRFLIATAVLFLASKSEETPRALNDVLRASCEILHKQDFTLLSYMLPIDWLERYRERITDAEQLILTTLNFELNVQHPYDSLTSTLQKIGFSQSLLVNLALNLVSEGGLVPQFSSSYCHLPLKDTLSSHPGVHDKVQAFFSFHRVKINEGPRRNDIHVFCRAGNKSADMNMPSYLTLLLSAEVGHEVDISVDAVTWFILGYQSNILLKNLGFFQLGCCFSSWLRSSLWLQFKPHQIAAGAAYLAAKFLNMNLASCHNVWHEFHTPPSVLKGESLLRTFEPQITNDALMVLNSLVIVNSNVMRTCFWSPSLVRHGTNEMLPIS
ncbi:UNVERIFIED_CONTAM: Cyclin-T1-4 [Sesamum latifolium]|uniref:Cyclin-T1-4 n=1 Tax=Sesamum latifolium TaxID=2727402 RepID=A0AAW2XYH7_9LAMI